MGNKNTTENKDLSNSFKRQQQNRKDQQQANLSKIQSNELFKQNPLELAKDQQGRLHPKWSDIVRKSQQKHKAKTDQFVKKIAEQTNRIGSECANKFGENQQRLIQCFQIVAEPIKKIQKRGQQKIMSLGKTANICLLSNKKQDKCIEEVRKSLHGCLQETLKEMKKIKIQLQ